MTTDAQTNPPTPTTILKNGAKLLCDAGYRQDLGDLHVANGPATVTLVSNLTGVSSVNIQGGTITFPAGTTYGTLKFQLPTNNDSVYFQAGSVTMKVDASAVNNWKFDQMGTTGNFVFPTNTTTTLTINNSGGAVLGGSVLLLRSINNVAESGTWSGVTNNVPGTTPSWTAQGDYQLSKAGAGPQWWESALAQFLVMDEADLHH